MKAPPIGKRVRDALRDEGIVRRNFEGPIINPHTTLFVRLDWEPPGHEPPCYPQPADWMAEHERLTQEGLARCAKILRAKGFAVDWNRGDAALIVSEQQLPFAEKPPPALPLPGLEPKEERDVSDRADAAAGRNGCDRPSLQEAGTWNPEKPGTDGVR